MIYCINRFFLRKSWIIPNILKTLWLDVDFYWYLSPVGKKLIFYRQVFIYRKIRAYLGGYSYSQIKQVETYRKWLLNPVENKLLV